MVPTLSSGWVPKNVPNIWNSARIIYIDDNAKYGAGGFKWPWDNVMVTSVEGKLKANKVGVPKWEFALSPRWLPDDTSLFFYGDITTSYSTYSLARWDGKSSQAQTLLTNLSWKIVQPSPSGRFLAFIRGGQPIPGRGGATPASLCTLDLVTKIEKRWGEAEPLFDSVTWARGDTLLFSLAPSEAERKAMRPTGGATKPLEWKPKIYTASLSSGQMRPLVADAMRPAPSPDGKWLLSLSYHDPSPPAPEAAPKIKPDPTLAQAKPDNALFLVLSRADGSEPRLVRSETRGAPNIIWFPDSSGFALCDTRFAGGAEGKTALSVAISRCEVKTLTPKRVGAFRYIAPVGTNMSEDERLWRPIAVTRDKRYLMSELTQFEAAPSNGLMLQRFDLQTGATETVAHIGSVRGLDWRE
jgi:hypothetical protein